MKIATSSRRSKVLSTRGITLALILGPLALLSFAFAETAAEGQLDARFRRGDANADGSVDVADCVALLTVLFFDGPEIGCEDAADINDDGWIDLADVAFVLEYLFGSRAALPQPGADRCGPDPTDGDLLGCLAPQFCR